jgi:hypothetical protein
MGKAVGCVDAFVLGAVCLLCAEVLAYGALRWLFLRVIGPSIDAFDRGHE